MRIPQTHVEAPADRAIQLAKMLLDENSAESFIVQATPFMPMQELVLGFVKLGCEVQTTNKSSVVRVKRRR